MSYEHVDVAIIGAGPYGLSLAAHLKSRQMQFRIFGTPMRFWLDMAPGISLKSFDFATNIYPPQKGYDFISYCKDRGITSHEPCAMEKFAEYGLWTQQQLVPEVEDIQVSSLRKNGDGFVLTLDDGTEVGASRVAVAVGLANFPRVPAELQIDSPRVSHTSQIRDYEQFRGMDVIVIGGGQSALEAGGLLNQHGATARMLIRGNGTWFADKMSPDRSIKERWKYPMTVLGPGQLNWVLEHFKWLPYELPDDKRIRLVRKHLGPFGTWWVRDQMDGKVPMINNTKVVAARDGGNAITLTVTGPDGDQELVADHVIAGTGYEVDVDRLPFLDPDLKASINRIERAPRLSRSFESSVQGLYFMGPAAMFSFGPLLRFACGADYAAPKVARHLAKGGRSKLSTGEAGSSSVRNLAASSQVSTTDKS
jgi:thioredoxin reductase